MSDTLLAIKTIGCFQVAFKDMRMVIKLNDP